MGLHSPTCESAPSSWMSTAGGTWYLVIPLPKAVGQVSAEEIELGRQIDECVCHEESMPPLPIEPHGGLLCSKTLL